MIAAAANLMWLASRQGAASRFRRQLRDPDATQQAVLRDLLRRNVSSTFGRQHGFGDIRTPAEFAARIPLATYDDLEPWVHRIMRGEKSVLTTDEVTHLVPTSGSSGARKFIPFTAQLQREFDRAISPWIVDLYRRSPSALFGPSYWSISPANLSTTEGDSVVPIGFEDDTSYLGGRLRRLVQATMAVPTSLRDIDDPETFFCLTLFCLLRRRDLRLISVWHPSFLTLLLDALPRHWESILDLFRTGRLPDSTRISATATAELALGADVARGKEIGRIGPDRPGELWPNLAVISCWTDAHAALGSTALGHRFPGVVIQPKGLLATEAIVTLPFAGQRPVAVGSHYFEFIDDGGSIQPLERLEQGQSYEVVVTTGGGLWRYRLGDRVRVDGFVAQTPSLTFVGRVGNVSDLCGEKLSGEFVAQVLRELGGTLSTPAKFAMLVPEAGAGAGVYTLYWEGVEPPTADALDVRLRENPHYAWCRQFGQLSMAKVFWISSGGMATYYRRLSAAGQNLGDIKPPALDRSTGWSDYFNGKLVE